MQQDNYLKNKLQQLDNQQLPDLSQMDNHWMQMQAMLPPAVVSPVKRFSGKIIWFIAAACVVILAVLLNNRVSKKEIKTSLPASKFAVNATEQHIFSDTTFLKKAVAAGEINPGSKNKKINTSKNYFSKPTAHRPLPKPQNNTTFHAPVILAIETGINKNQLLGNLAEQLKKTTNHFAINNSKDTLLDCNEGAGLLIPAYSLGGEDVTVSVTEFYKKSEIVLNGLTTTSDGNLLESGGMLHIGATKNGIPVHQMLKIPIRFYLADSSQTMKEMQLFNGEEKPVVNESAKSDMVVNNINWIGQPQYFQISNTNTEVKVLDIRNEPYKTIKRKKGVIAVFNVVPKSQLSKNELKKLMKEKYGYYKVRFGFRENSFFHGKLTSKIDSITYSAKPIGDSAWINKNIAVKYNLAYSEIRTYQVSNTSERYNISTIINANMANEKILEKIKNRYSVDINSLGWINCDKFNYDSRQKVNYAVDLGDSASNYYTVLVFDKIKSVIAGITDGNKAIFTGMPLGEKVKIVSIGIGKKGETIMAIKETTIEKNVVMGVEFEHSTVAGIKSSLSIIDK